jgi:phosphate transport system substrate-binding protein
VEGCSETMQRRDAILLLTSSLVGLGCDRGRHAAGDVIALNGAGATFPFPLYSKWIDEYQRDNPDVRINYQSIGSGGGVRQVLARTVDFGATDAPMSEDESRQAAGRLVHVPTAIGAVVLSYNLGGVPLLKLTPRALSAIFLGEIRRWNDPLLAEINPGVALPALDITVVFRSDGSGTTAIFTEYLRRVSPSFAERVGSGKNVRFPVGVGAKGNEGTTGQIKTTPGAIGYLELAYATQSALPRAEMQNRAGKFIAPSTDASLAAAQSAGVNESLIMSLSDAAGDASYPLSAYTYFLVYREAAEYERGRALARFMWWAAHEGQRFALSMDYAPLPKGLVTSVEQCLRGLRGGGKPLIDASFVSPESASVR